MIPYGRQEITEDDIAEVEKVLRSDFLTQGPIVPKFEKSVADYCGASHAIAVNSATSALHIACLALGSWSRRLAMDFTQYFCSFCKLWSLLWCKYRFC